MRGTNHRTPDVRHPVRDYEHGQGEKPVPYTHAIDQTGKWRFNSEAQSSPKYRGQEYP